MVALTTFSKRVNRAGTLLSAAPSRVARYQAQPLSFRLMAGDSKYMDL